MRCLGKRVTLFRDGDGHEKLLVLKYTILDGFQSLNLMDEAEKSNRKIAENMVSKVKKK